MVMDVMKAITSHMGPQHGFGHGWHETFQCGKHAGTSLNISIRNAQLQLNLGVPQIQPESTRRNIRPWFSTDFHSTYLQTGKMQITSTPSTTMKGVFNRVTSSSLNQHKRTHQAIQSVSSTLDKGITQNVRNRGVMVGTTSTGPAVGYASTIAGNNGDGSSGVHNDSVEMIVIVSGLEPTPMIEVGVLFGLEILALWLARTRFLHGSRNITVKPADNQKNKGMPTQQAPGGIVPVQIAGYAHPGKTHPNVGYKLL
ncbi:hypothetical protein Tco_0019048 [Tanacetum coccineum]